MYWYTVGHTISAVPSFELEYHVPSHRCWDITYHPKIPGWGILYHPRACTGMSCVKLGIVVQNSGH